MDHIHVDPEMYPILPKHSSDVLGVQLPGDVWKLIQHMAKWLHQDDMCRKHCTPNSCTHVLGFEDVFGFKP